MDDQTLSFFVLLPTAILQVKVVSMIDVVLSVLFFSATPLLKLPTYRTLKRNTNTPAGMGEAPHGTSLAKSLGRWTFLFFSRSLHIQRNSMIHYLNSKLFHRSASTFFSAMMNDDKFRITTLPRYHESFSNMLPMRNAQKFPLESHNS